MFPAPSMALVGSSDVRICGTLCPAVMFGVICVSADQCRPQSVDVHQLTPALASGTTTRPQTVPGAAPGGGGWTSGTPPMSPVWPDWGAVVEAPFTPPQWFLASAGVKLTPAPEAPAVPTFVTVTTS